MIDTHFKSDLKRRNLPKYPLVGAPILSRTTSSVSLCLINGLISFPNEQPDNKQTKEKVWEQNSFCLRITVCLSVWHSTFENHNHKTGIYSQGSGSTSVSLVLKQQLPTGQSWVKCHESHSANMSEPESFLKKALCLSAHRQPCFGYSPRLCSLSSSRCKGTHVGHSTQKTTALEQNALF